VQSSGFNHADFVRLATHGCALVSAIIITGQHLEREDKALPPEIVDGLKQLVKSVIFLLSFSWFDIQISLCSKLRPIATFVEEHHGVKATFKQFFYKSEHEQIAGHRDMLTRAFAEFGVRLSFSILLVSRARPLLIMFVCQRRSEPTLPLKASRRSI
jgi:hypothetical protein